MSESKKSSSQSPLSRRHFLGRASLGLAGLAGSSALPDLFGTDALNRALAAGKPPNIVIMVPDDTGWKDVSYHGSRINTPNIDRMARQGVELDQFYAYPVCSPTRASLLTGRPPTRYGVTTAIAGRSRHAIPKTVITLAEFLRRQGYNTAITGKWHLGLRPEVGPRQYGFDYSYGYLHGQIDQFTHLYKIGDPTWHRNDEFITEVGHATDLITDEAIKFITSIRNKARPFFLYVPFSVPHTPLQEYDMWLNPYLDVFESRDRQMLAASMTHMDHGIGRILAALGEEGLEQETLSIFFSDNGGSLVREGTERAEPKNYFGHHGPWDELSSNDPLRGGKGNLYEGGIRVPAAITWPGHLSQRRVDETMVVYDLYPTLAGLIGATLPPEQMVEGIDVWPALEGKDIDSDRTIYWRSNRQAAVRKGDWKLIHAGVTLDEGADELFNIAQDPYEKTDLAKKNPRKLAELRSELKKQLALDAAEMM
ncbi:sulfatase-like hydrolase/transferase [candidate division KSB1 bacterium]